MSLTPVECANCGAKYRLPETFQADKAKCKKCGAMIDVASQRSKPAATAPEATRPAAATASSSSRASSSRPTPARRSRRPKTDADEDAPSKGRSSRRSSAKGDGAPSRTRRSSRRRGDDDDGEAEGDEPRGRREPKKSNTALIAGSVIGVLAVVLVVIIFVMQGDDEKPAETQQQAAAPTDPEPAKEPVDSSPDRRTAMRATVAELPEADRAAIEKFLDAADKGETDLEAGLADVGNEAMLRFAADSLKIAGADAEASKLAKMATVSAELNADQRQQVVAVVAELAKSKTDPDSQVLAGMLLGVEPKAEPAAAKKPKKKAELTSHEDVFKPRDELEPLPWPDFVSEEEQTEITEALEAMRFGGLGGKRAKTKLEELDAKSVVGIVNQLAALNYFDSEDTMFAYELNRLLGAMAAGVINAGFRPCELGAEVSLEDADWNGKTVKAWRRFAEKYGSDEASLKRLRKKRRANPGK